MEIIIRTAEAEWESKSKQRAAPKLRRKWNAAIEEAAPPSPIWVSFLWLSFLLRPDHCGCYNFDDPPFHLLPPTATGTGTQICLADRMRYNDNADDARNELQLLRLECATILVEQSSLDWLHLSGQWDLCRRVGKVDSVVVWLRSAWSCGSFTVFKFVSICAIISWLRFAYATSTSNKLPPSVQL